MFLQTEHNNLSLHQIRSFEEHQSGVNQILKLSEKKFVTCSDDCVLKFWNNNKPDFDISVETITCIAKVAGDIVIAGCHSGNLLVVNTKSKAVSPIDQAHLNLVRGIVSLDYVFKGEYFISADVCGFIKVWRIVNKMPSLMQTI
jgi:WD40 repeat protein